MNTKSIVEIGLPIVLPIGVFILIWELGALFLFDPDVIPGAFATFEFTGTILVTGGPRGHTAVFHLQKTLVRVAIVATAGIVFSTILGIVMATNQTFERALSDWLPFWMTIPTVVVILISMIIFKFSEFSIVFAAVIAAVPFGTVNLWEGMNDVNRSLIEMAHAFGASQELIWRKIYVPHLMPFVFGSFRYVLGIVWKVVALAEVFGIDNGIGAMFRFWYGQGEIIALLAYLIIFIGVMLTLEYGVLKPIEEHVFEWRELET